MDYLVKLDANVLYELGIHLDVPEILRLCRTNKEINRLLCQKDAIWKRKLKDDFPEYLDVGKEKGLREQYKLLYGLRDLKEKLDLKGNLREIYELKALNMYRKNITKVPESIGNLSNLKTLHFYGNDLTSLPESIGNLPNLEYLILSFNKIESLPESIGNLSNLKELHLDSNRLTSLPESIGDLSNLKFLYVSDNPLTSLPESIGKLSNLREITLYDNDALHHLPESLKRIPGLKISQ